MAKNRKQVAINDIYTALLGLTTLAVIATTVFVAIKCSMYYDTIFKVVGPR